MKLQFKHQKFQADAAKAVVDVFAGQPYTYIKTMYELNKHYGWSKFTVVVPGVAIREGVYKSFEVAQEHFKAISSDSVVYEMVDSYEELLKIVMK